MLAIVHTCGTVTTWNSTKGCRSNEYQGNYDRAWMYAGYLHIASNTIDKYDTKKPGILNHFSGTLIISIEKFPEIKLMSNDSILMKLI